MRETRIGNGRTVRLDRKWAGRVRFDIEPPRAGEWRIYQELLLVLQRDDRMRRMAERYPVFLRFEGGAFSFHSPEQVDEFVTELGEVVRTQSPATRSPHAYR